jgi:LAO/AO transport system kinase
MLAGAGDELQGVKRGIIEMLDGMAITKADGDNKQKAERARVEYANALHFFPAAADGWAPSVVTCSSLTGEGIAEIWQMVLDHRQWMESNECFARRRSRQSLEWMHELIRIGLEKSFQSNRAVSALLPLLQEEVQRGQMTSFAASRELLRVFQAGSGRNRE